MKLAAGLALLLALGACRADTLLDFSPAMSSCSAGGKLKRVCRARYLVCVKTFKDGGRRCRDGADCEGACLAVLKDGEAPPDEDKDMRGECQRDNKPCGCQAQIKDGVMQPIVCAD